MLVFEFIHRIIDILTDYLSDVSESSIRENFVTVYQVICTQPMTCKKVKKKLIGYIVIGRNDGLRLSFNNRTKRIKRNHYATYNYE
jgi:hypothetical protein